MSRSSTGVSRTKSIRQCIGFGEFEGRCGAIAGTRWSDHWCLRCDKLRLAHITKQMEHIRDTWPKEQPR